jgi:Tfp pilus assembly protein PilO
MNRILIITILLFISFLFFIYFLFPQFVVFENLNKKVLEKENFVQKEKIYFSGLEKISEDLKEYKESLEKINAALPSELSIASLFKFFQDKANENGVFLKALNVEEASGFVAENVVLEQGAVSEKTEENFFSLIVIGDFFAFENFLKEIERSSRMIEVEKITLEKSEEGLLEFNLVVKVRSLNKN